MIEIIQRIITTYNDQDVIEYEIKHKNGFSVSVQNYGGVISKIMTPDKYGAMQNVVLSAQEFDSINQFHLGAITGRVAGRIKNGMFSLNNCNYTLATNNGPNHLHGGLSGFNQKFWKVKKVFNGLELTYLSPHNEENYPGELLAKVSYLITNNYELTIQTEIISDSDSIANVTNHSYFDLSAGIDPMSMELQIDADYFAPIDKDGCVINQLQKVENTHFDFRQPKSINYAFNQPDEQMIIANYGYDHPFLLNQNINHAVYLADKKHTGITLKIITDEPCCVIYTSNWLKPQKHAGICFETQKMPNAINWDIFRDSVIIKANENKINKTTWKFGVIN